MLQSNLNIATPKISNGSITLDETLNDYPKLTLVEYTDNIVTRNIGSVFNFSNLTFILEGFNMSINPLAIKNNKNEVTYNYTHISKKILEYPIRVKDFYDINKSSISKKTTNSFFFSIGLLIEFAKSKTGNIASVNAPAFLVEINKNPSSEDVLTLKELLDNKLNILGYVYHFTESTVSFKTLGSTGFIKPTVVSNINIGYNSIPNYKNTLLTWSKKDDYDKGIDAKKYIQIKDNEYITYEGDYLPHLPPSSAKDGTLAPRDLSIMIDNSGETKNCKITKHKWGQPELEISATFGYAHAALELIDNPQKPSLSANTQKVLDSVSEQITVSGNALEEVIKLIKTGKYGYPDDNGFNKEIVWRLISIKETNYVYESFDANISPVVKKDDGTLESVTIPNEYQKYLSSNMQVLVREESSGWEIKRFAQEDSSEWAKGSILAWLQLKATIDAKTALVASNLISKQHYYYGIYMAKVNLEQYLFRKIPLWERTDYAIEPYTRYYKDLDEVDWEVKYIPRNQLYPGTQDETEVAVLYPDPNWEPQLMVSSKSRLKTAVGLSGNPNYKLYERNYYGSNPLTVTTGSEEYEFTKYGILPSKNTRSELSTLYSDYNNVSDVLSAITSGNSDAGTYYKPQLYMDINDYGIKGKDTPKVGVSGISNISYPNFQVNKDDQYTTLLVSRVAQDHSYKSHITSSTYNLSDGRPPRATIRKPIYEEDKTTLDNPYKNSITYITDNLINNLNEYQTSVNIPSANNVNEALQGARFKLTLENVSSGSTVSAQISYKNYSETGTINSKVTFPGITGNWIVKRVNKAIQFSNGNSFVQPISIEAGRLLSLNITSKTVQEANENKNSESTKVLINPDLPSNFGTPLSSIPDNFSRWLDTNSQ